MTLWVEWLGEKHDWGACKREQLVKLWKLQEWSSFSRSFAIKGNRERRQLLKKIVVSRDTFIFKMTGITAHLYADKVDQGGRGK